MALIVFTISTLPEHVEDTGSYNSILVKMLKGGTASVMQCVS